MDKNQQNSYRIIIALCMIAVGVLNGFFWVYTVGGLLGIIPMLICSWYFGYFWAWADNKIEGKNGRS